MNVLIPHFMERQTACSFHVKNPLEIGVCNSEIFLTYSIEFSYVKKTFNMKFLIENKRKIKTN